MNAEDLDTTLKKNMAKLSKSERCRAIETVRDIIRSAMYDDAAGSGYKIERCPRCGSVAIVKKGKSRSGEQRYLFRDYGRMFSGSTDRILGVSKLLREAWMAYAECFVLMLPLRECADRCGVCLRIAYTSATGSSSARRNMRPSSTSGRGRPASSMRHTSPSPSRATTLGLLHPAEKGTPSWRADSQVRPLPRADLRNNGHQRYEHHLLRRFGAKCGLAQSRGGSPSRPYRRRFGRRQGQGNRMHRPAARPECCLA